MKIMFLIRSLKGGGAERQLSLLARELQIMGHTITILVYYKNDKVNSDLLNSGVKVISLEKRGRWDLFLFLIRFLREVKKEKPEVLYSFLTTSNLFSILCRIFFPSIKLVWGLRASNMELNYYDWINHLTYFFEKKLAFLPHKVIANSYAGKRYALQSKFLSKNLVVIHNGIDVNTFHIDSIARRETRTQLGIFDKECLIGMVARIDPMKDHETFLKMASNLLKKREDVRFLCVGSATRRDKENLINKIRSLDLGSKLIFLEDPPHIEKIYNALDLLCLTSAFGEGFSNVLGEAMASGVRCVATDVGDAEMILGPFGKVVPIRSPIIIADACNQLLNEKSICDLSRQRIIEHFSVEAMAKKTETTLLELLKKQNPIERI